jgi:hypothetical protein
MRKRAFFLTSVVLAIIALIIHLAGRDQSVKGSEHMAQSISAAVKQNIKAVSDPMAADYRNEGRILDRIGIVFTFSSVICLLAATYRRESGWYSIPILLLFFDLMAQMLL